MNAATCDQDTRPAPPGTVWSGLLLLLVIVLGSALLGRIEPMTWSVTAAIAAVGAGGILAVAWLMQRHTRYPRWAWWTTAGLMAAALLASLGLTGSPAGWEQDIRPTAWMLPWFLYLMGVTSARKGVCSPEHPRAGWTMVTTGVLMSALLLGANAIADWVKSLFTGPLV